MRPPEQSLYHHAATGGGGENGSYLGIGIVRKVLVWVAAPIREEQLVAFAKLSNRFQKAAKVGGSVHQGFDLVPGAPRVVIATAAVELGEIVTSLRTNQEPTLENIVRHRTKIPRERLSAAEGVTAIVTSFGPSSLA
jgi:hypothetical protein